MNSAISEYQLIPYEPKYREQTIALQQYLWGPDASVNAEYLRWKYDDNPYTTSPLIHLALHDGRVIAMRGMFGTKWLFPGQESLVLCLSCADMVVHPDHRRKQLFAHLTMAMLEDKRVVEYDHIINLSSGPHSTPGYLKLGWQPVGNGYWSLARRKLTNHNTPSSRQPQSGTEEGFKWKRIARRLGFRLQPSAPLPGQLSVYTPFSEFDKACSKANLPGSSQIELDTRPRSNEMAELVARHFTNRQIQHIRDNEFYAWRFRNPLCQYRFLYWSDSRLRGFIVLQAMHYENRFGISVVDWEFERQDILAELLQTAIRYCSAVPLNFWGALFSDQLKDELRLAGFTIIDLTTVDQEAIHLPSILWRNSQQELEPQNSSTVEGLLDISNWDLRAIFSDGF